MPHVDPDALTAFAEEVLVEIGTPPDRAADVADSLVSADLSGHSSHGTRQLHSKYAREAEDGRIDPGAEPVVENAEGVAATVDGRLAFGQLVGRTAVDAAVERADEHGVGVVGLKRTSHIGRIGEWAERACDAGVAFAAFVCNPGSRWVSPPGSAERRFSTNPVSVGVPTFDALEFPLVVDVATSQVAHGKIRERAAAGHELAAEWAVDDAGEPIRDARRFEEDGAGGMLPLGGRVAGYKGFGLSVLSELLAANVADGTVSGMDDVIWGNHAAFVAIDLSRFTSRERTAERAAAMAEYVRATDFSADLGPGAAAMGEETLLPGEAEHRARKRHRTDGVPVSGADAAAFDEFARDVGVDEGSIPAPFR
ncbi:MAG: Ldh family oxidoreductase [Haloferacaceae archaeon]